MADRNSVGAELNLTEEYVAVGKRNRPGTGIIPSSITVHNTSNASAGADAIAHSRFVRNKGYYIHKGKKRWVSWHYTVDDTRVIKQLPIHEKAYHAGRANQSSIAIETCMHEGIDQDAANDRLSKLVAVLLYDLGLTINDVKTHHDWTGKNCPILLRPKWDSFLLAVSNILDAFPARAAEEPRLMSSAPETLQNASAKIDSIELGDIADEEDIDHQELVAALEEFLL